MLVRELEAILFIRNISLKYHYVVFTANVQLLRGVEKKRCR